MLCVMATVSAHQLNCQETIIQTGEECLRATGGGAWCNSIGKSGGAANGEIVGNKRSTATLGVDASFFQ